nr:hypothetical protein [Tanacetum cinerariifolium]
PQHESGGVPAQRCGVRSGRAGLAAGTGQQQHYLPLALSGLATVNPGARFAAAG